MLNFEKNHKKCNIIIPSKGKTIKIMAGSALTVVLLFSGCTKNMDCNIKDKHFHLYQRNGIKTIYDSEKEYVNGYEWTDKTVKYTDELNEEVKALKKTDLVRISSNTEYLTNYMEENNCYIEYEYSYMAREIKYYIGSTGISSSPTSITTVIGPDGTPRPVSVPNTPVYHYVQKEDFTRDESVENKTGDTRVVYTRYYAYKISVNDKGKKEFERSELTDDILEIADEYPYFNPYEFVSKKYEYLTPEKSKTLSKYIQ